MSQTSKLCRLCVNHCQDSKSLYDENGQQNVLYETTRKYFHPTIVNLTEAQHLKDICLVCWSNICDFQSFQTLVAMAQLKLRLEKCEMAGVGVEEIKTEVVYEDPGCMALFDDGEQELTLTPKEEFIGLTEEHRGQDYGLCEIKTESNLVSLGEPAKNLYLEKHTRMSELKKSLEDEQQTSDKQHVFDIKPHLSKPDVEEPTCLRDSETFDSASEDDIPLSALATRAKGQVSPKRGNNSSPNATKSLNNPNAEFKETESENLDEVISKIMPSLKCFLCPEVFTKYTLYREHFRICHPYAIFHVSCCNLKFYTRMQISEHMLFHNNPKIFKCQFCGVYRTKKFNLRAHISRHHPETLDLQYKCSECDKAFTSQRACSFHYTTKHCTVEQAKQVENAGGGTMFVCKECDFTTKSVRGFSSHRWYSHLLKPRHKCQECGEMFKLLRDLRKHVNSHAPKRIYTCSLCSETFKTQTGINNHKTKKHANDAEEQSSAKAKAYRNRQLRQSQEESRKFAKQKQLKELDELVAKWLPNLECIECSESFVCLSLLQDHFRSHHDTKKFHISCCNRKLTLRSQIKEHFLLHNDPNAFNCKVCGHHFKIKHCLVSHMAQKHADTFPEKYACADCPQMFVTEKRLNSHYRARHLNVKQNLAERGRTFTCKDCGKVFQQLRALNRHSWLHRNKPKHVCSTCGKGFRFYSALTIHVDAHKAKEATLDSDLKCSICGKKFKSSLGLKRHLGNHKRKDIYACASCPQTFINLSNYELHCKIAHPQDGEENIKSES